jgi:hypothetical protein
MVQQIFTCRMAAKIEGQAGAMVYGMKTYLTISFAGEK